MQAQQLQNAHCLQQTTQFVLETLCHFMLCDGRASLCCAACDAALGRGRLQRLDDGRNDSCHRRTNEPVKKVNKALNS